MTIDEGQPIDEIQFDYLAGLNGRVLRRPDIPAEANNEVCLVQDKQGSTINLAEPDNNRMSTGPGYTFDAWGQSFQPGTSSQPSPSNNIRYHGGFVESFLSTNDKDGIYRMGARHYSTIIGRFLQRDPLLLNVVPNAVYPLALNPYIYALNRPTYLTDTSGWAPGGSCCGGGHPPNPGFKPEPARPPFPIEPGGGVGGPMFPVPCRILWTMYFYAFYGSNSNPTPGLSGTVEPGCVMHYPNPNKCCVGWDPLTDPEGCCCIMGYKAGGEKHWPKKIVPLVDDCCDFGNWETNGDPIKECNQWCCGQVYGSSDDGNGPGSGASPVTYLGRGGGGPNPYIPTLPMRSPSMPGAHGNQPGGLDPGFQIPGLGIAFGMGLMGEGGVFDPGWNKGPDAPNMKPFNRIGLGLSISSTAAAYLIAEFCEAHPMNRCCCTIWEKGNYNLLSNISTKLTYAGLLAGLIPGPGGLAISFIINLSSTVLSAIVLGAVAAMLLCFAKGEN